MQWEYKEKHCAFNFFNILAIQNIKNAKNNKRTTFSKNLVKYIKHFEADPVPGFNGSYNWLYTGGNLSVSNINENLLLISADYVNNSSGLSEFYFPSHLFQE